MSRSTKQNNEVLFSYGMFAVLGAQFLSALADNALLFVAIAFLKSRNAPEWQIPFLQEVFVISFILLAPFVGPFADALPKGRVMLLANAMKVFGAATMFFGTHPLLAYNLVGIGAAAYSPAKYGILGELVTSEKLVKANSMMEGSTIVAILFGTVMGGWLSDWSVHGALTITVGCYVLSTLSNLLIPPLPAVQPLKSYSPVTLVKDFGVALAVLSKHPDTRFSLLGTSVFWGAGSTLRFMLVAWVPIALSVFDNQTPATLSGVVAVGIALGAAAAGKLVSLNTVNRVLPAGLVIGVFIMLFAHVASLSIAILLLMCIGLFGGFYVVPLNALLQDRSHTTVGVGHAIAVQNFLENISMLLMVGFYILMIKADTPVVTAATGFGALVLIEIFVIAVMRWRSN